MANRKTQTATIQRISKPLRFASLCVALAVALLSSVLSGGLPRTTVHGSAFNPATTAVALQPSRAQPRIVAENVRRDDDPGGQGGAVAAAPPPLVPSVSAVAIPHILQRPAPEHLPAPYDILDGSPRGPPLT